MNPYRNIPKIFNVLAVIMLCALSLAERAAIRPAMSIRASAGQRRAANDSKREYAYGPARGLPNSKVGTFSNALMAEAKKNGWVVISMKNDWKRIFAFEK